MKALLAIKRTPSADRLNIFSRTDNIDEPPYSQKGH